VFSLEAVTKVERRKFSGTLGVTLYIVLPNFNHVISRTGISVATGLQWHAWVISREITSGNEYGISVATGLQWHTWVISREITSGNEYGDFGCRRFAMMFVGSDR
jgi:hypothetical protein